MLKYILYFECPIQINFNCIIRVTLLLTDYVGNNLWRFGLHFWGTKEDRPCVGAVFLIIDVHPIKVN